MFALVRDHAERTGQRVNHGLGQDLKHPRPDCAGPGYSGAGPREEMEA